MTGLSDRAAVTSCQPANMSFEVFAFILGIIISIALIFFAIWNVSTRTCPKLGVFLLPTQFVVSPFPVDNSF